MNDSAILIREILHALIGMDWTPLLGRIFYVLLMGAFLLMLVRRTNTGRNTYTHRPQKVSLVKEKKRADKSRRRMINQINRNTERMRKMKESGKHFDGYIESVWDEVK